MELAITQIENTPVNTRPVEIVERKGLGHPDTICDALAEKLSLSLSKFYLEHFGLILHHNVDKALLWGGSARPQFGGGEVIEPIEIFLAGRALCEHEGIKIPVEELVVEGGREWIRDNLRGLVPERHVRFHCLVRPGASDLAELFLRQRAQGLWLANDTSCGVGYAPLSDLETVVSEVERALNSPSCKEQYPHIGEDIKVMGLRRNNRIQLTIGCAFVDRYVEDIDDYGAKKSDLAELAQRVGERHTLREISVAVNTADDPRRESVYLTVTGTSAEAGDDGEAGRGNRANGLIAPYRPMTMESVAGKNPVTHVGKLYNVTAGLIAEAIVDEVDGVGEATCLLVSQIGQSIGEPQITEVNVRTADPILDRKLEAHIQEIVHDHLGQIHLLSEAFVKGRLILDHWPFRRQTTD